ncbi:MAG: fatty acid desaturase [Deltaproteobacteria bacterium]|nr:fatty acid desaturase [Deltaproteobacteria bacterium]MBI3296409.1 fatty acid desaturase [Deltaproteobacteria bacterium]
MTKRLHFGNVFLIGLTHALALAAIPFFSWKALLVCLGMLYTICPIGVNMTYHRLLTHRGFKVPTWFEYVLSTIAAMSAQGPMMLWVAEHRLHHQFSDSPGEDPHTPQDGLFHAHIGHLFYHKDFEDRPELWQKYVPDLLKHPYYRFLDKYFFIFVLLPIPFLYWAGGISFVMWGVFVRIVLMWHTSGSVNSLCHRFGYRTYEAKDLSRNFWLVGLVAAGEGWHNNHHAYPTSARHGLKWWELDATYGLIRLAELVGLATDVKRPVGLPSIPRFLVPSALGAEI